MHEREQRAAEEKKKKSEAPTVRTEVEQRKHDEQKAREGEGEQDGRKKEEDKKPKVKIRPLSDARAIELGANFFSEAFIFGVAVSLLLLENYRSSRKASNRRDEVQERLDYLEVEVDRLRHQHNLPELEALNERLKKAKEARSWWNPAGWWRRTEPDSSDDDSSDGVPGEVEGSGSKPIPGNVPGPSPKNAIKPVAIPESTTAPKGGDGRKSAGAVPERVDSVQATNKVR